MPKTQQQVDYDQPVDVRTAGLGKEFLAKLAERQKCAEAKKREKELSQELTTMIAESGYKTVLTPDWRVTFTPGKNVTINKERLLELGVSAKIIAKATKTTTYETVTVTAVKDKE